MILKKAGSMAGGAGGRWSSLWVEPLVGSECRKYLLGGLLDRPKGRRGDSLYNMILF